MNIKKNKLLSVYLHLLYMFLL